mgnify:CR=1 FL=1
METFNEALAMICTFYDIPVPKVEWYEKMEDSKIAGLTFENGRVHLYHPEDWAKHRVHNTMQRWREVFFHEIGHVYFWTAAEDKAEAFSKMMLE